MNIAAMRAPSSGEGSGRLCARGVRQRRLPSVGPSERNSSTLRLVPTPGGLVLAGAVGTKSAGRAQALPPTGLSCRGLDGRTRHHHTSLRHLRAVSTDTVAQESGGVVMGAEEEKTSPETFSWREQWYPIIQEEDLSVGVAYKFTLFDEPCVAFLRAKGQDPVCFVDRCPHRMAPLSEGVLTEEGDVMCAYHGWRFNQTGDCTLIPQTGASESGTRACATALPATVVDGLLWVYFDPICSNSGGALPAPPKSPDIPGGFAPGGAFVRDMPVDAPLLLENILDPDHGEYAHGNFQGFAAFQAQGSKESRIIADLFTSPEGAPRTVTMEQEADTEGEKVSIKWMAPMTVQWNRPASFGRFYGSILFWVVPMGVGKCRFISRSYFAKPNSKFPTWFFHMFMNNFLDQDTALIAAQGSFVMGAERALDTKRSANYVIRSPSDKLIVQVGRFLDICVPQMPNRGRVLASKVPEATEMAMNAPSLEVLRSKVLDRMSTHVSHCKACQKVNQKLLRFARGLLIAAGVLGTGAVMLAAGAIGAAAVLAQSSASATGAGLGPKALVLWAAGLAVAAAACLVARMKAQETQQNIVGYVYPSEKYRTDLQKIPGVMQYPPVQK